jgi:hypothetical protein
MGPYHGHSSLISLSLARINNFILKHQIPTVLAGVSEQFLSSIFHAKHVYEQYQLFALKQKKTQGQPDTSGASALVSSWKT